MLSRSVSLFGSLRACLHAWFGLNLAFGLVPERLVGWRRRMLCVDFRVFVIVLHNVFFYIFRFTVALKSVSVYHYSTALRGVIAMLRAVGIRRVSHFTVYLTNNQFYWLTSFLYYRFIRITHRNIRFRKKIRIIGVNFIYASLKTLRFTV
jgi:hypothetical protein